MAFFPQIGPFYEPDKEQEIFTDSEGRLKSRQFPNSQNRQVHRNVDNQTSSSAQNVRRSTCPTDQPDSSNNFRQFSNHRSVLGFGSRQTEFERPTEADGGLADERFQPIKIPSNCHLSSENTDYHSNDIDTNASCLPYGMKPEVFSPEHQDFLQELDNPLSAHYENSRSLFPDESFYEKNNNVFNSKFRGSDHSSCSYGSEYSQSVQSSEKKSERNKQIYLMPQISDSRKYDSSGAALCEQLFGIILCQYNHKPNLDSVTIRRSPALRERKVIVQDVVPGSPAEYCRKIHRGDMLISVNDIQVSWMNLGTVFRALSHHMEAKLTVRSPVIIGTPPHPSKSGNNLYKRLTNTSLQQGEKTLHDYIYGVLYLTLEDVSSEENNEQGDIIYQYPSNSNCIQNVRGLFITLAYSLVDVTGYHAKSSTLLMNNELVHVSYIVVNRDVLVLLLPAKRVSLHSLNMIKDEISQLLKFMFGDVKSAFQKSNSHQLDQLFALTFRRLLTPDLSQSSGVMSSRFFDSEREIRMLHLSDENKLLCDEILSEFEAMDFDEFLTDDQMDSRRSYTTLGSLLFYKNWLLSSHLSWSDQSDINLYLKHHALYHIMASKSLDNLVIWLEVFPTARCDSPLIPLPGYVEPRGRWFLLIVGLNNYLMCSILETGGISQQVVGNPSVDMFFVDQIKSTLEQLDEEDVSMSICCEESICSEEKNISLANVDKFLPKIKTKDDNISPQKIPQSPKTPVSPMKSDPGRYKYSPHSDRHSNTSDDIDSSHGNIKRQGSKLSYGSNDSTGSSNSAGQQKILSKVGRLSSVVDISGIGRSLSVLHLDTPVDNDHNTDCNKVTRGRCNVLFNYIQIDSTNGVIITPTDTQFTMYQSAISTQLINSIYHCCSSLRKSFHYTRQTEKPRERKKSLFESSDKIRDVEEQGVLFNLTPNHPTSSSSAKKSQPSSLSYWVIGRRFREDDKEIYVCFHESVPQSTVEMAFTLGFGS